MARELLTDEDIAHVVQTMKRIAVLGIKTAEQAGQPAYDVAAYLSRVGFEVVPVPVYYPDVVEILGQPVYRKLAAVPGLLDVVDVFRKSADVTAHVEDIIAARPKVVWLQSGIRNDAAAARLIAAGIDVVQDRCLYVEHARRGR